MRSFVCSKEREFLSVDAHRKMSGEEIVTYMVGKQGMNTRVKSDKNAGWSEDLPFGILVKKKICHRGTEIQRKIIYKGRRLT